MTISILILAGSDHSVVSTYRDATIQWFAGRDIYTDTGHGFLYLPVAAILFAPFAWLPSGGLRDRLAVCGDRRLRDRGSPPWPSSPNEASPTPLSQF